MMFGCSVALVLGACAGPRTEVTANASPTADFRGFKTYAFVAVDRLDMAGSRMMDPVSRRNIEEAIGRELQAKGLSPAASDKPNLLVSYFADVYEAPDKERPSTPTAGVNWSRQGKLTIELIDTMDQQVVWRGEAWARDPNFEISEQVIAELLRKYPAR